MALSGAERQRLYIQRLRDQAGAPRPDRLSRTSLALSKAESRKAWLKVRKERRAYREASLGWHQRLNSILDAAAKVHGADAIKKEAWELFGVKWTASQ